MRRTRRCATVKNNEAKWTSEPSLDPSLFLVKLKLLKLKKRRQPWPPSLLVILLHQKDNPESLD